MVKEGKTKILVVDDDNTVLKMAQKLLAEYDVHTASDGVQAMAAVKKVQPDLIVLDIMMPEMNGYDVCHALKFDSPYKDIPILLLTSREQEIDARIGQMMGVHYMQKPLKPEPFLAQIKKMLK